MQATRPGVENATTTTALSRPVPSYVPAAPVFRPSYGEQGPTVVGIPQAAYGVAMGQSGAGLRLAAGTVLRSGLIAAGFYLAGVRGWKPLVLGSLASSTTISLLLAASHAIRERRAW